MVTVADILDLIETEGLSPEDAFYCSSAYEDSEGCAAMQVTDIQVEEDEFGLKRVVLIYAGDETL